MEKKLYSFIIVLFALSYSIQSQTVCELITDMGINTGENSSDKGTILMDLPNGGFLALGTSYYSGSNHFEAIVAMIKPSLNLDLSFGENGKVSHRWDSRNNIDCAALQSDGKILIGGYQAPGNGLSSFRAYIARLNSDGSVDTDFGSQGSVKLEFPGGTSTGITVGIHVMEEGKIRVVGVTYSGQSAILVAQLNADGTLDEEFGDEGMQVLALAVDKDCNVYFEDDGSFVLIAGGSGTGSQSPVIIKIDEEGVPDFDFGQGGVNVLLHEAGLADIGSSTAESRFYSTRTVDGDIVFLSKRAENNNLVLAKVSGETGEFVSEFGSGGVVDHPNPNVGWPSDIVENPITGELYVFGNNMPTIWKLGANGNLKDLCSENNSYSPPIPQGSAIVTGLVDENQNLNLLGNTYTQDILGGLDQNVNMMVLLSDDVTGVEDLSSSINIYPNPVDDQLTISGDFVGDLNYQIFNLQGKLVLEGVTSEQINTETLGSGQFQLRLFNGDGFYGVEKLLSY